MVLREDRPGGFVGVVDDGVAVQLKVNTEAAIKRGVFGAPTMFVGNEMFFGQDRLDFVEEEVKK